MAIQNCVVWGNRTLLYSPLSHKSLYACVYVYNLSDYIDAGLMQDTTLARIILKEGKSSGKM